MPEIVSYRVTRVETVEFSSADPSSVAYAARRLLDATASEVDPIARLVDVTVHRRPREESILVERRS